MATFISNSSLIKGLTLAGNVIYREIIRITSRGGKGGYPKKVREGISLEAAQGKENWGSIAITSRPNIDGYNYAIMFELGTGLTGPRGQKYKIAPKNASVLKFPWTASQNISSSRPPGSASGDVALDKDGNVYLPYVMHPGMRPNPFLQQAVDAKADEVLEVLGQSFEYQILDGPKVEVIK